ncbi:metal-dependent transcriptional regulator [Galbibacter sp.]|jgi:DtxR family Mn-dependent transcriptional regulator|uniref:metal-dependent transcriptional regulator n=1 Tax=Galbibacter sp. TaxID=2918471 RepID=UPI003A90996E
MTYSEEDYIKAIYHLSKDPKSYASTSAIAARLDTKASSVTDMIQKLSDKKVVHYKKYQGVRLTEKGEVYAASIVRKHRLWEYFLVEKLNFSWDEVHDVAEELEHIKSDKLIERLDAFLDYPKRDPHGDPIPDEFGKLPDIKKVLLSNLNADQSGIVIGVKDSSSKFLRYLDKLDIALGTSIRVLDKEAFDNSMTILIDEKIINISALTAANIFIKT